jgi:group II intron reverse transcriptase/maturase
MRNPTDVLKHLHEKSQDKTYRFQRLYRNLYNPEFYMLAYQNIYANGGSMTPGVDGTTMDGMGSKRIQRLIASLKDQSYQPKPARRTYIAKQNDPAKKRPLGIPSGDDKLVQEVIRMLLETIYEPIFSDYSHGFRPRRSCHTALTEIAHTFTGTTWFVEGDITACFDSFDHHVLIQLLRQRIDDEKFIALMWKFLKAGYMDQWQYNATYSGTPQGSGMSPVLANIYLHELDTFVGERQTTFDVGDNNHRKVNRAYYRMVDAATKYKRRNRKHWADMSESERRIRAKTLSAMKAKAVMMPPLEIGDTSFKRLKYVRYADDFIIGVIGSKADAEQIKAEIKAFLSERLHLTLSEEKTKITHSTDRARFLGYDITVSRSQSVKRQKNGVRRRVYYGNVMLYVPKEKWITKLRAYKAIRIKRDDVMGTERWKVLHRTELINRTDIDILHKYNAEVRGLYNYYRLAHNASIIGDFGSMMKYSMFKTFAAKYRTTVQKIKARYFHNGDFTVSYPTRAGMKQSVFYNSGYKRQTEPMYGQIDTLASYKRYSRSSSLAARIKAKCCELCGAERCEVEMHQVKRLKDLRGKSPWELMMLDKRRKTLAVCHTCHEQIHSCDTISKRQTDGEPDTARVVRPVREGGKLSTALVRNS